MKLPRPLAGLPCSHLFIGAELAQVPLADGRTIEPEQAHTQYLARKYRPSLFNRRRLERTDPDPLMREAYSELRARIDRKCPVSFKLFFSIEPIDKRDPGHGQLRSLPERRGSRTIAGLTVAIRYRLVFRRRYRHQLAIDRQSAHRICDRGQSTALQHRQHAGRTEYRGEQT